MKTGLRDVLKGITREHAKRQMPVSLEIMVPGIGKVCCGKVLRVTPSKRITCLGQSDGKRLVVKLFYSKWRAYRHWERSESGCRIFIEKGVPAPSMLFSGYLTQYGVYAAIFEFIEGSTLGCAIEGMKETLERYAALDKLLEIVARQHACGIIQDDLHLGNFMIKSETIYSIDGDHVKSRYLPIGRKASMKNLAQLLANHPAFFNPDMDSWIRIYANKRGWVFTTEELEHIKEWILRIRKQKVSNHLRKAYRKWIVHRADPGSFSLYDPQRTDESISTALEAWGHISREESCCVSGYKSMHVHDKDMLVCSSSCLGPLFLRRLWPVIRVLMSSFMLGGLGIETPQPIAVIGKRKGIYQWYCSVLFQRPEGKAIKDMTDAELMSDGNNIACSIADAFSVLKYMGLSVSRISLDEIFVFGNKVFFFGLDAIQKPLWGGRTKTPHAIRSFLSQWPVNTVVKEFFADQFKKRDLL